MWTPASPNPHAIKRVPHPLPVPEVCNHCGGRVYWTNNVAVYRKPMGKWPYIYVCECCEARVGMHPETNIPLGTLATAEEREARKSSKAVFTAWYEHAGLERGPAYKQIAKDLEIPADSCHFAMFDVETCKRVEAHCSALLDDLL